MITRVELENYRCFRNAVVDLDPFTVLVGPNSSGKSVFLKALMHNHEIPRSEDFWQHQRKLPWRLVRSGPFGTFELRVEGIKLQATGSPRLPTRHLLQLELTELRSENLVRWEPLLATDGSNLANVFGSLPRATQAQVAERLATLVPSFGDVDLQLIKDGNHRIRFRDLWNENVWYAPDEVSDGTMLILAYLLLQHQPEAVEVVCIEEPERGLHPYLLGQLVDFLRKLSRGEVGPRKLQVILATHSAELLDHVAPEEVRFFSRDQETGGVRVDRAPTDHPDWKRSYAEYNESLGAAWLSGGLGGVP